MVTVCVQPETGTFFSTFSPKVSGRRSSQQLLTPCAHVSSAFIISLCSDNHVSALLTRDLGGFTAQPAIKDINKMNKYAKRQLA